ncbi:PA2169 family four-helix-bundle protein [Nostoc ellipsosporum NOK]|nr:PA2169 family four-helix-bundle protein [Nostoc ellipsosporum NOK]
MLINEKTTETLNDLIRINNDRIEGYERAEKETDSNDADLRALFSSMASESRQYVNELTKHVAGAGAEPADGTTVSGKIYRAWMDVKATFSGKDRKAILASCEFGEDAAQKAYDEALASDAELPTEIRQLIMDQKTSLKKSHDQIKAMRDRQPA